MKTLYSLPEAIIEVQSGKPLLIAADESLLKQLPIGKWIGGTIPYFISEDGGVSTKDKLFITDLSAYVSEVKIISYSKDDISNVYKDSFENGFSSIIIPYASEVQFSFALDSQKYEGFGSNPLIGWISGVHLDDVSTIKAKVFSGIDCSEFENKAIVMHCKLAEDRYAEISIINIFKQSDGDTIHFLSDGFEAVEVEINGKPANLYDYIKSNNINIQYPLVADYLGAKLNISIRDLDDESKKISFYAPVFKDVDYKLAQSFDDYIAEFMQQIPQDDSGTIAFSCNCILNYLYCELEGKKTGGLVGPITFGEIAYMLLNQTFVYLHVKKY